MLITKNFSYGLPQGFTPGEAGLDVFNLKNFSANYIRISKYFFTVTKNLAFSEHSCQLISNRLCKVLEKNFSLLWNPIANVLLQNSFLQYC